MAVSSNGNWQAGKKVLECNQYMLDNQLYCDVKFKVGKTGKLMSAHKYVLASRSSVFAAMFFGGLPETSDAIVVSDIEAEVFDILLRFLYCEDQNVSPTTVIGTLYAAEKYAVTELVDICRAFLESNITVETICDIMENARIFNLSDLFSTCVNFIFKSEYCAKKVFESSGFLQCSRECLESLVKDDELPLTEETVYKSLIRWAEYNCKKEGKNAENAAEIRSMLGSLFSHVRFPLMSLETFWKDVADHEILTSEEKIQISRLIAGKSVNDAVFITTERCLAKIISIMRVDKEPTSCFGSQLGNIDAVKLEVNKPVDLHGLILYGSEFKPYTYKIEIKILYKTHTLIHVPEKSIEESTQMFQINFEKPCHIYPNKVYTLWIKMRGPRSYVGKYSDCVSYEDYTFQFYQSDKCTNDTSVSVGQIPGLLCRLKR